MSLPWRARFSLVRKCKLLRRTKQFFHSGLPVCTILHMPFMRNLGWAVDELD